MRYGIRIDGDTEQGFRYEVKTSHLERYKGTELREIVTTLLSGFAPDFIKAQQSVNAFLAQESRK
jgi:hypothetical protein